MKLTEFSNSLTVADFQTDLDSIAVQFSIESGHQYTLNGDFQKPKIDDRAYRGRTGYIGEWRETRLGVRFPRVTFYSQRHGGESIVFDGFKVVMDLYRRANKSGCAIALNPAPAISEVKSESVDERGINLRRSAIQQLWKSALPANHAESEPLRRYLQNRGLSEVLDNIPATIRFHPALEYRHQQSDGVWQSMGHFPAMVAVVQAFNGRGINVHRIYLTKDGKKAAILDPDDLETLLASRKLMPSAVVGESKGAAIRLHASRDGVLAVGEGIETMLAVHSSTGLPVWSCISAHGLATVEIPTDVHELTICADHDANGTGYTAAQTLAQRMSSGISKSSRGMAVKIIMPNKVGMDWADVLSAEKAA